MKYLYTRNNLNYLKCTDAVIFQMKSYMFINHYGHYIMHNYLSIKKTYEIVLSY